MDQLFSALPHHQARQTRAVFVQCALSGYYAIQAANVFDVHSLFAIVSGAYPVRGLEQAV